MLDRFSDTNAFVFSLVIINESVYFSGLHSLTGIFRESCHNKLIFHKQHNCYPDVTSKGTNCVSRVDY